MTKQATLAPFPSTGEVLLFISNVLCLGECIADETERKQYNKKLNDLAKERNLDIERFDEIINEFFTYLPEEIQDTIFADVFKNLVLRFFKVYKKLVITMPSAFADRSQILWIITPYIFEYIVISLKEIEIDIELPNLYFPTEKFWYLPSDNKSTVYPIENVLNWWINITGKDNLHQFSQFISTQKNDESYAEILYKKLNRWKNGDSPTLSSLKELTDGIDYSLEHEEDYKRSFLLNSLIARAVQIVYKNMLSIWGNECLQMIEIYMITSTTMDSQPEKVFDCFASVLTA